MATNCWRRDAGEGVGTSNWSGTSDVQPSNSPAARTTPCVAGISPTMTNERAAGLILRSWKATMSARQTRSIPSTVPFGGRP